MTVFSIQAKVDINCNGDTSPQIKILQQQNENLRNVIKQMRDEVERLNSPNKTEIQPDSGVLSNDGIGSTADKIRFANSFIMSCSLSNQHHWKSTTAGTKAEMQQLDS